MAGIDTSKRARIAGLLFFLAGTAVLMGIITAEAFYPAGYKTGTSHISDLGGVKRYRVIVKQPSATIFNTTMMVTGGMIVLGTCFLHAAYGRRIMSAPLLLLGIGIIGVGVWPGDKGALHTAFASMAFVSGGVAAVACSRAITSPFRYVAALLGCVAIFFFLFDDLFDPILGNGGVERWVAYPMILCLTGFGGYLLGAHGARPPHEVYPAHAEATTLAD